LEQLHLYNYGLTGITNHINDNFYQPAQMQKTILPNQEYMFYTSMLVHESEGSRRNEFILKDETLFYKVGFSMFGSTLLTCGEIKFEKE